MPRRTADTEKVASASQQTDDVSFRKRTIRAGDQDLGSRAILMDETELIWYPAEVNTSIRPGWFWHESENDQVRPLNKLIDIFEKSVGGNATCLLNIPPTREGLFHENDVARLREFGDYLRTGYGTNLLDSAALTAAPAAPEHEIACVRTKDETYYLPAAEDGTAEITLRWDTPQTIRRVVLMEQLLCSQRVERCATAQSRTTHGKPCRKVRSSATSALPCWMRCIPPRCASAFWMRELRRRCAFSESMHKERSVSHGCAGRNASFLLGYSAVWVRASAGIGQNS